MADEDASMGDVTALKQEESDEKKLAKWKKLLKKRNINQQSIDHLTFNEKTMLLVVSDVHVGDLHLSRIEMFARFLKRIVAERKESRLPNLQCILIIGDFYDRLYSSLSMIERDVKIVEAIKSIFVCLNSIQASGIPVVHLALGNHENPVDQTGFGVGRDDFFKELSSYAKINIFQNTALYPPYICQYAVLKHDQDGTCNLYMHDSLATLGQTTELSLPLQKTPPIKEEYRCLFMHGHQLMNGAVLLLPAWKSLLDLDDVTKEKVLAKYNSTKDLIVLPRFDKTINFIQQQRGMIGKSITAYDDKILNNPDMAAYWQTIRDPEADEAYKQGLKNVILMSSLREYFKTVSNRFLRLNMQARAKELEKTHGTFLRGIDTLIFGHTHDVTDIFKFKNPSGGQKIATFNTGAWCSISGPGLPSYIEIHTDGLVQPVVLTK